MDVHHRYLPLTIKRLDARSDEGQGENAQIATSGDGQVLPQEPRRCQWELYQRPNRGVYQMRVTGGSRHAITPVPDREHARVVAQSGGDHHLQRPQR